MIAKKVFWKQNIRQDQKFLLLRNRLRKRFPNVLSGNFEKGAIFKIVKQMTRTNQDVVGEKCIRNDHGDLSFDDSLKEKAWKNSVDW